MTFKLYTCTVRLAGNADNEVIKHNVTAPEIKMLEMMHAGKVPAVINIVHTGEVKGRSDLAERKRLADEYTRGELVEDRGRKLIEAKFGVSGVPLPTEYVPEVSQIADTDLEDEADAEEIVLFAPKPEAPAKQTAADLIG